MENTAPISIVILAPQKGRRTFAPITYFRTTYLFREAEFRIFKVDPVRGVVYFLGWSTSWLGWAVLGF